MSVVLAHFTDPHLPLAGARGRELFGKRILGWLSWRLRRHRAHKAWALEAVLADMRRRAAEATFVLTGDVVNISTRAEFAAARAWLERLAAPEKLMLIPGNHDFYVADALRASLPSLMPWMTGRRENAAPAWPEFPLVRYVGNVALIGLNSAYPAPWREASGFIDAGQLARLGPLLRTCRAKGLCRVVLVHHPPLPKLNANPRKALKNAAALQQVLVENGAELALFGHVHAWMRSSLPVKDGVLHVLSAPSASMIPGRSRPAAGWQRIVIDRRQGTWRIAVERRVLTVDGSVQTGERLHLFCTANQGGSI